MKTKNSISISLQADIISILTNSDMCNESNACSVDFRENLVFITFFSNKGQFRLSIDAKTHKPFAVQFFSGYCNTNIFGGQYE